MVFVLQVALGVAIGALLLRAVVSYWREILVVAGVIVGAVVVLGGLFALQRTRPAATMVLGGLVLSVVVIDSIHTAVRRRAHRAGRKPPRSA